MPTPVLLLSSDEQAVHVVSQVLTELGLVVERPAAASSAIREIEVRSFNALVIDCDDLASAKLMFDALKRSKLNQGIPAIAVVSGGTALPTAFRLGAQFVITKPASLDQVRHTLRAASSKMKKEAGVVVSTPTTPVPARALAAAAGAAPAALDKNTSNALPPVSSQSAPSGLSSRAANLKADSPSPVQSAGFAVAPARVAAPDTSLKPVSSVPSAPVKKSAPKADSDDPMLADLDDLENPGGFVPPPFTQLKLKRRTPIVAFTCVMIMLAGAGTYFAWMTRPDFRDFVMYQYVKVRALIGKPVPPPPAPVQSKPAPPPPAPATIPATPEESAPASSTTTTEGSTPAAPSPEVTPVVAPAPNSTQPYTAPANRQR